VFIALFFRRVSRARRGLHGDESGGRGGNCTRSAAKGRSDAEDGEGRQFCFAMESGLQGRAGKLSGLSQSFLD